MKRKVLALTFILTFLFSTVAATECINFTSANPSMYMYPCANQTLVSVYSPENHSIQNVKWLKVNFTVDLTEWKGGWGLPVFNPDYSFSSAVTCYLDSTPVWQKTLNSAQKHNFSFTLNDLSDGLHNIIELNDCWHSFRNRTRMEFITRAYFQLFWRGLIHR